ncbi:type I secretion system permease/ATPase [Limnohabitans sp. Hippo4]|uniref:type I secretion system permease/ATPase n=1 Tax=Limnohabitans sp. Hippo4 TaxID=1826167 RepID=UPI000D337B62|nr:type I secretion system permease/ATPase [Limnohabitans sp. Hippo4]PUE34179.1 type I secretion system permease/ATPase [Limnohabitans sp. Hippo4]
MKTPEIFNRNELSRTLWELRREFVVAGIFSLVANLLLLAPTLYMLQIYDRVMVSQSTGTLLVVSLITLFFFGVLTFSEWSRTRLLVRTGVRLDEMLSRRLFHASYEAHLNPAVSNPSRAFGDLTELRQFLTGNGIFAFFDAPWTPIYIAVLFLLHPWLGFMSIFFGVVQSVLAWWGNKATKPAQTVASKAQQEVGVYLQSKFRNAEVLESMGMLSSLYRRWAGKHLHALGRSVEAQAVSGKVAAWSKFVRYTQQSFALGGGALLVIQGELSPGAMIAANVLTTRALAPIDLMVGTWGPFLNAREAFGRLKDLLEANPLRDLKPMGVTPQGNVVLKDVVASAPGRETPILKGVSAIMPAGTITVVLGASGSGKSTLARVLLGIWPHTAGEVLLDDQDIRKWDRMELGPHVGYLPQDIELFDGTIAENIARAGKVESEKVIAAAEASGLHNMILRFPKGYDTPMGEAGGLLSGGQRQRIGLARALYGQPALVVLDEPNANLDDEGEAALVRAVQGLKAQNKTVVLISHRPGVVSVADRLLILHEGAVHASGPRDGVLAALQKQREEAAAAANAASAQLPAADAPSPNSN